VTTSSLWGILAIIAFITIWICATVAFLYTRELRRRDYVADPLPIGYQPGALRKLRAGSEMTDQEIEMARDLLAARGSIKAFAIPATLFCLGSFFVFGSLEQLHGHPPSERTFLGIIPMLTATNLSVQIIRSARLKRRLPTPVIPPPAGSMPASQPTPR
jgi:hypothetical protein